MHKAVDNGKIYLNRCECYTMEEYRGLLAIGYIFLFLSIFSLIFDYKVLSLDIVISFTMTLSIFAIVYSIYKIRKESKEI
jgi:hypothetical protein